MEVNDFVKDAERQKSLRRGEHVFHAQQNANQAVTKLQSALVFADSKDTDKLIGLLTSARELVRDIESAFAADLTLYSRNRGYIKDDED